MTDAEIKQLQELVDTHDGLHHTLANAVYDTIPWGDVNNPTSEAQNDYLYDKCIEAVEAVLEPARPALAALLRERREWLRVVSWAKEVVAERERHDDDFSAAIEGKTALDGLAEALDALAKETP